MDTVWDGDELANMAPYLAQQVDPAEIWEGRAAKRELRKAYARWLLGLAPWCALVTLTFRDEKPEDSARAWLRKLVRELNESLLGKRYRRVVGESYFSYAAAFEYQLRGALHFHMLVDRPIDFRLIHERWASWAGWAWTDIVKRPERATKYVVKYAVKHGELDVYKASWTGEPIVRPGWWDPSGSPGVIAAHELA